MKFPEDYFSAIEKELQIGLYEVELVINKAIEAIKKGDSDGDPFLSLEIHYDEPLVKIVSYSDEDKNKLVEREYTPRDLE